MNRINSRFSFITFLLIAAIIFSFSIPSYAIPSDSLKNLVQWKSSEGGNDHWYGIIPLVRPWVVQREIAESFNLAGQSGYLLSITSSAENQFVVDNILSGNTDQPSIADEFYIGGHDSLGWRWMDGTPFSYTNWASGEPSGDGIALAIWGASQGGVAGKWNDVPEDTAGHGPIHQLWAIVEFDPVAFNPQDSLINLVQWTTAEGGNDHWYGVLAVVQPWNEHETWASTLDNSGVSGSMVSITSEEENQFIEDNILSAVTGGGVADEFYLGGTTSDGWISGEAFIYTNWDSGEPNGDGIGIAMWGASLGAQSGTWNDVVHDGPIGSNNQLYSIIEFGEPDTTILAIDTVINLVQWQAVNGGNDNWYGIIPIVQPWNEQRALAEQLDYNGHTGYLATITSGAENQFIHDNILVGNTNQPSVADEFFIGGYDSLGWGWITGESFDYTNWDTGEPNGDGAAIAMWGASTVDAGQWNDVPEDTLPPHSTISQLWAIVEFGDLDTTTVPVDTVIEIVQWPVSEGGNDHYYGIIPFNQSWYDHNTMAGTFVHEGETGYLATITSPAENQFIHFNILKNNTSQPEAPNAFYTGGFDDGFGWEWTNGESFVYNNWDDFQPDGSGSSLIIHGAGTTNAGEWDDVPADTLFPGSDPLYYAIVEFGAPVTLPLDSLINIVQWPAAAGGNDHWYGVFAVVQPWNEHVAEVASMTYAGEQGYLTAINSLEENQFIIDSILNKTIGGGVVDEFFIGGRVSFGWINGEEMNFTYWANNEPSGDGDAIAVWGATSTHTTGTWNDVPETGAPGSINQLFSIVEFGEYVLPLYDSLVIESATATSFPKTISVSAKTQQPIKGATIPLKIPTDLEIIDISTAGLMTDSWDYKIIQNKADDSGFVFVSLANSFGAELPVGVTDIFTITFTGSSGNCAEDIYVYFDTTLSNDVSRKLTFVDSLTLPVYPQFDKFRNRILLPNMLMGDADNNGAVDIADIVFMVDYMFLGGPAPKYLNSIDTNGDCLGPDIADLVRFVEYTFSGGPYFPCGCVE